MEDRAGGLVIVPVSWIGAAALLPERLLEAAARAAARAAATTAHQQGAGGQ